MVRADPARLARLVAGDGALHPVPMALPFHTVSPGDRSARVSRGRPPISSRASTGSLQGRQSSTSRRRASSDAALDELPATVALVADERTGNPTRSVSRLPQHQGLADVLATWSTDSPLRRAHSRARAGHGEPGERERALAARSAFAWRFSDASENLNSAPRPRPAIWARAVHTRRAPHPDRLHSFWPAPPPRRVSLRNRTAGRRLAPEHHSNVTKKYLQHSAGMR